MKLSGTLRPQRTFPGYGVIARCDEASTYPKNMGLTLGVVVNSPLPRNGGMANNLGAPEARKLSKTCTRDCKETESRQKASGAESA